MNPPTFHNTCSNVNLGSYSSFLPLLLLTCVTHEVGLLVPLFDEAPNEMKGIH